MGKQTIYVDDVKPLIDQHDGNIAAIARQLGVSRGTIHNRIQESPELQKRLVEARETMLDEAESVLYREVKAGNITALIFFLKTRGRNRGYTERHEITGAEGSPLIPLAELIAALREADEPPAAA